MQQPPDFNHRQNTDACVWREDEDGAWDAHCGGRFEFTDGGPTENGFIVCPYCGGELQERRFESDAVSVTAKETITKWEAY